MTQPVADAAIRREVLHPLRSFIVQAPAGSGKTELLIQRFLVLLATVDHPEAVVAITFTRKAAAEMRFRLVDALRRASSDEPPAQPHALHTWTLARAALDRDRELGWQLLANPARLRIFTIDALCLNLVRQMPWLSRLGAPPRPEENPAALYREAASATLDLLETSPPRARSVATLLSHLDNNYAFAEQLLVGMLAQRDQWLVPLIGMRAASGIGDETASGQADALRRLMEEQLAAIVRSAIAETRQALLENDQAAEMVHLAAWAAANLDPASASPIRGCLTLTGLPGGSPGDLSAWLGLAELFLKKDGERRSTVTKNHGFPAGPENSHRKDQFKEIYLHPPELALLHNLRSLPPTRFDDRQWRLLAALFDVLPIAVVQLRAAFQRAGAVDFIEIAQAARLALGPADSPSDLAFSLDYRVRHWLVDEFQDTSHGQFSLLEALTAEWQRDDGRTVFLVGDPMQSIYAFREAEVGLFLRARHSGLGPLPLEPRRLSVNFRSQQRLVDWVNDAFPEAFPPMEDIARGAVTFEPSAAFHPPLELPAVTFHAFPGSNYALEAERVVTLVRQARAAGSASTAILVRTRSHLLHIAAQLQQAGLRYRAVEIDPLAYRPVVQDLLALTRALLHPADRPAWLAILRAPWCGLQLADLLALAAPDANATIHSLLLRDDLLQSLPSAARDRLQRFTSVIHRAVPLAGRAPIARLVEATWHQLGGPACLDSARDLEDAEAFFHLLDDAAPGAAADLELLHERIARLFAQPDPEADDWLQLMTIHKSKGLEFDTVILPGLARVPRGSDASLLLWMDQSVLPGQIAPLLAPIKEAGAEHDLLYRWVQTEINLKFDYEVTRLLYVAVTRARKQLHLLAHFSLSQKTGEVNKPDRRTLMARLWPVYEQPARQQVAALLESLPQPTPEADAPAVHPIPLRRLPAGWTPPASPAPLAWQPAPAPTVLQPPDPPSPGHVDHAGERAADRAAERESSVLRALLPSIAHAESAPADALLRALLAAEGTAPAQFDASTERLRAQINRLRADQRSAWLLAPHSDAAWSLHLAASLDGKLLETSIDRTIVDGNGIRWLIAFRMPAWNKPTTALIDADAAACAEFLSASARLLALHDPAHPIRTALFYPWLCAWRESSAATFTAPA